MIVYTEVFIAENFIMNYVLLMAAARLARLNTSWLKAAAGAAVGAAYAFLIFPKGIYFLDNAIYKVLISLAMCFLAFGARSIAALIKNMLVFWFTTVFIGGGIIFFVQLSGGRIDYSGGVLISSDEFKYILAGAAVIISLSFNLRRMVGRVKLKNSLYREICLENKGKAVNCVGFVDTGNRVYDAFGGQGIIVEREVMAKIYDFDKAKGFEVAVATAAGAGRLECVAIDGVAVGGELRTPPVVLVYDGRLSKNGLFNALIGAEYLR